MREFFRGWKRKIACVTLLAACLFTVGWVRSLMIVEELWWSIDDSTCLILATADGYLFASPFITSLPLKPGQAPPESFWLSHPAHRDWIGTHVSMDFIWHLNVLGFGYGSDISDTDSQRVIKVPYWSLVLPLMTASAYLLRSKPRPTRIQETTLTP